MVNYRTSLWLFIERVKLRTIYRLVENFYATPNHTKYPIQFLAPKNSTQTPQTNLQTRSNPHISPKYSPKPQNHKLSPNPTPKKSPKLPKIPHKTPVTPQKFPKTPQNSPTKTPKPPPDSVLFLGVLRGFLTEGGMDGQRR